MGCTVVSTIIATIIIFSDKGLTPLKNLKLNPHPAFGLVCLITALIQPMMAALRPGPYSDKRWIFNIAHWLCGMSFLYSPKITLKVWIEKKEFL